MKLLQATVISSLLIGTSFSAQNISIVGTVSHTFNLPKVYPNQKIEARVRTPACDRHGQ